MSFKALVRLCDYAGYDAFAGSLDLLELLLTEDLYPEEPDEEEADEAADPESEAAEVLTGAPLVFIVHEALKVAPGSTASLFTDTVPSITADAFKERSSDT